MDIKIQEKLVELEKTSADYWNIPPEAGRFMNLLIKSSGYKNILELGTSNGYSAIWLAEAVKFTGGKLRTVEFYEERTKLAKGNLDYCGLCEYVEFFNGSILQLLSEGFFRELQGELDFVFIDANKSEYIDYLKLVDPHLKKGGIIVADNVLSHPEATKPYVERIQSNTDYETTLFDFGGGLLVSLKLKSII